MVTITVSLDTSLVEQTLERMTEQLGEFPDAMAEELTDWQRDDMHRKYPNTTLEDTDASTLIWPRSRLAEDTHRQVAPRRAKWPPRIKQRARAPVAIARGGSTRPLLRPELFEKLADRMAALMADKLNWVTSRSAK